VLFIVAAPYKAEYVSDEFCFFIFDENINEEINSLAFEQKGVIMNDTKNADTFNFFPKSVITSTIGSEKNETIPVPKTNQNTASRIILIFPNLFAGVCAPFSSSSSEPSSSSP